MFALKKLQKESLPLVVTMTNVSSGGQPHTHTRTYKNKQTHTHTHTHTMKYGTIRANKGSRPHHTVFKQRIKCFLTTDELEDCERERKLDRDKGCVSGLGGRRSRLLKPGITG